MTEYERLKDVVANCIRISNDEADALLAGKTIRARLYIDGNKYLNVELQVDSNSYNGWRIK